jgi:hypothetical protein
MNKVVKKVSKNMLKFIKTSSPSLSDDTTSLDITIKAIKKTLWCLVISPLIKRHNETQPSSDEIKAAMRAAFTLPVIVLIFERRCRVTITSVNNLSKLGMFVLLQISKLPLSIIKSIIEPAFASIIESRIKRGLFIIEHVNNTQIKVNIDGVIVCKPVDVYSSFAQLDNAKHSTSSYDLITFIQRLGRYIKKPKSQLTSFLSGPFVLYKHFCLEVACMHYLYEGSRSNVTITKNTLLQDTATYIKLANTSAQGIEGNGVTATIASAFQKNKTNLEKANLAKRLRRSAWSNPPLTDLAGLDSAQTV